MATNITEVRLLAVPLENDYKHTIVFRSEDDQINYFKGKTVDSQSELTYQRKDNVIRYPSSYENIQTCNYVMYKNKSKWYYAFITKMEYVNEERTDIYIETDVLQTWRSKYSVRNSFIEREHCNNDGIGLNTVPEGLETGEYVCYRSVVDESLKEFLYVLQVSEKSDNDDVGYTNFGGMWQSGFAYVFSNIEALGNKIAEYNNKSDAIICCYVIPAGSIAWNGNSEWGGQNIPSVHSVEISRPTSLGKHSTTGTSTTFTYTPKNNKLLTFPYQYLLLSNNNGSNNVLQYENFSNPDNCVFRVKGVPVVGGSIKCTPQNYKGAEDNQEEGLILGKYPTTSVSNDMYTAWLTQNAVNIGVGIGTSALSIIGGVGMMFVPGAQMAGAGMVASGVTGVASSIGQIYEHSFTPNSAQGNTNGGDINTCDKTNTFYFKKMGIKEEYARIIDDFFTMYGYKTNRVKTPNTWHRENFWYTKTIDVDINSSVIPNNDMRKIKDIYNSGVTFWVNPDNVGNYGVSNNIKTNWS